MTAGFGMKPRAGTYYKKQEPRPSKAGSCSHNQQWQKSLLNIALS
jgi:hypothetical protein